MAPGKSNKKQTARMSMRTRRGKEPRPRPPQHLLSAPAPFESDYVEDPDVDLWEVDFSKDVRRDTISPPSPIFPSSQGSSSGGQQAGPSPASASTFPGLSQESGTSAALPEEGTGK
ncbi:hypothetical protein B484DRAFT_436513 [Ochromonadaceae sp. CCMP2298]|nr:hypothetical protein B484DRAFT_436513 [Ochromonadaceae sp. CCMP2298]